MEVSPRDKAFFEICRTGFDHDGILAAASRSEMEIGDIHGVNLLLVACMNGNLEIVKMLIDRGISVTARDNSNRTPLQVTVMGRKSVHYSNSKPEQERVAYLNNAKSSEYCAILEILLDIQGIDINERLRESHPILLALKTMAHTSILDVILKNPDLNLTWEDCRSAMEEAVKFDSHEHLKVLLATKDPLFDPNYILPNELSLLGLAVSRVSNNCMITLLDHDDIDPNCCGEGDCRPQELNPILFCLNGETDTEEQKDKRREQLRLLWNHRKLNINDPPTHNGEAPIHKAVLLSDSFFLRILLDRPDIQMNVKSGGEFSPLKFCVLIENLIHTSLILQDQRVFLNKSDEEVQQQQQELLGRQADLPPLMEAIYNGTSKIVELFLAAGADPNGTHWHGDWGIIDVYAFNMVQCCEAKNNSQLEKQLTVARMLLESGSQPRVTPGLIQKIIAGGPRYPRLLKNFKATVDELKAMPIQQVQSLVSLSRNTIHEQLRRKSGKFSTVQALNNLLQDQVLPFTLGNYLKYDNVLENNAID